MYLHTFRIEAEEKIIKEGQEEDEDLQTIKEEEGNSIWSTHDYLTQTINNEKGKFGQFKNSQLFHKPLEEHLLSSKV